MKEISICLLICLLAVSQAENEYIEMQTEVYIHLNKFRTNLTYLRDYTEHEFSLWVYTPDSPDLEFPLDTEHYICYDDKDSLEDRDVENLRFPLRACSKRGMLRQGGGAAGRDNFLKDIDDAMAWSNDHLRPLEWSDALTLSASWFLEDLDGCHLNPDQLINDEYMEFYLDSIATYDDHRRIILFPRRFKWED